MRLQRSVPDPILNAIRTPLTSAGGVRLDAAVAQPLGLYLDVAGEGLRERLFVVEGPFGGESCLRPDFTVAAVTAHMAQGGGRQRYFYEGHAFRVAPPATGRAEEFLQLGLEFLGQAPADAPEAADDDAAMAAMAWHSATAGGRSDLTLLLGDIDLFAAFLAALEVDEPLRKRLAGALSNPRRLRAEIEADAKVPAGSPKVGERLARILSPLSEGEASGVLEDIWILSGIEPVGGRTAAEIVSRLVARAEGEATTRLDADRAGRIGRFLDIAGEPGAAVGEAIALGGRTPALLGAAATWEGRIAGLVRLGVPRERIRFEAGFGRAFGYYDGALFEVRSAELGDDQPVAAGGRYDSLPVRLGGPAGGGALGCMVRPFRAWREAPA